MRQERNIEQNSVRRVLRVLMLWICVAWSLWGSGQTRHTQQKRSAMKRNERVWVTSWATAPVSGTAVQAGLAGADGAGATGPASQSGGPAATESASHIGSQTLRQQMRISLGGEEWRLELTNEFGTEALAVDDVRLALSADGSSSEISGPAQPVTFHGAGRVSIPPGALMLSDPVAFTAAPLARLSVSLHLPAQTIKTVSWHYFTDQTNWIAAGDVASEPVLENAKSVGNWAFVKGLEIRAPVGAATMVAFGDSITEGVHSTRDRNRRWPDLLAERLAGQRVGQEVGVANEGIGGNRILSPGAGPGALARFDRDVLARAGVRFLIVLEGINDIGNMPRADTLEEAACSAKAEAMIGGLIQMVERAHRHGVKVYGATILPFEGAAYFTEGGEQVRQRVNAWIRTAGAFDNIVDLDQVTRDPAHPARLLPAYDPGDHLHPNDEGYKAMADSVDLRLFQVQ